MDLSNISDKDLQHEILSRRLRGANRWFFTQLKSNQDYQEFAERTGDPYGYFAAKLYLIANADKIGITREEIDIFYIVLNKLNTCSDDENEQLVKFHSITRARRKSCELDEKYGFGIHPEKVHVLRRTYEKHVKRKHAEGKRREGSLFPDYGA